jgi:hypothetical protein
MNERIKELVGQAKFIAEETINKKISKNAELDAFAEKFAELIVRECAGLFPNVYVEIENEYGHTPVIAADYIKKHFGVEE